MNYYVYYKVTPEQAAELRQAIGELFRKVHAECGVQGRWMRRRDDPATYMEVYEGVKDAAAFEKLMSGVKMPVARRLEIFTSLEIPA
jgi:quinol monooxygenase YgiN